MIKMRLKKCKNWWNSPSSIEGRLFNASFYKSLLVNALCLTCIGMNNVCFFRTGFSITKRNRPSVVYNAWNGMTKDTHFFLFRFQNRGYLRKIEQCFIQVIYFIKRNVYLFQTFIKTVKKWERNQHWFKIFKEIFE